MSFYHRDYVDANELQDNPYVRVCHFCGNDLEGVDIDDVWPISDQQIIKIHDETSKEYKEIHGLEDYQLDLRLNTKDISIWVDYCNVCGWWRLIKDIWISAVKSQSWHIFFGCAGTLRNLNLNDINSPIEEIRSYLSAKYQERFNVNPRLYEFTVASVFKSLGYNALVTGYTNDGGVDIILDNDTHRIGVQVKRYKNKIKVEQIRSLIGAMVLNSLPAGIFVTTSDFQLGASKIAASNNIELINSQQFYGALKLAQIKENKIEALLPNIHNQFIPELYYYGYDTPANSL